MHRSRAVTTMSCSCFQVALLGACPIIRDLYIVQPRGRVAFYGNIPEGRGYYPSFITTKELGLPRQATPSRCKPKK